LIVLYNSNTNDVLFWEFNFENYIEFICYSFNTNINIYICACKVIIITTVVLAEKGFGGGGLKKNESHLKSSWFYNFWRRESWRHRSSRSPLRHLLSESNFLFYHYSYFSFPWYHLSYTQRLRKRNFFLTSTRYMRIHIMK